MGLYCMGADLRVRRHFSGAHGAVFPRPGEGAGAPDRAVSGDRRGAQHAHLGWGRQPALLFPVPDRRFSHRLRRQTGRAAGRGHDLFRVDHRVEHDRGYARGAARLRGLLGRDGVEARHVGGGVAAHAPGVPGRQAGRPVRAAVGAARAAGALAAAQRARVLHVGYPRLHDRRHGRADRRGVLHPAALCVCLRDRAAVRGRAALAASGARAGAPACGYAGIILSGHPARTGAGAPPAPRYAQPPDRALRPARAGGGRPRGRVCAQFAGGVRSLRRRTVYGKRYGQYRAVRQGARYGAGRADCGHQRVPAGKSAHCRP